MPSHLHYKVSSYELWAQFSLQHLNTWAIASGSKSSHFYDLQLSNLKYPCRVKLSGVSITRVTIVYGNKSRFILVADSAAFLSHTHGCC